LCLSGNSPGIAQGGEFDDDVEEDEGSSTQAVAPRKANKTVAHNFRRIVEDYRRTKNPAVLQDVEHALLFLRSQRQYKVGRGLFRSQTKVFMFSSHCWKDTTP